MIRLSMETFQYDLNMNLYLNWSIYKHNIYTNQYWMLLNIISFLICSDEVCLHFQLTTAIASHLSCRLRFSSKPILKTQLRRNLAGGSFMCAWITSNTNECYNVSSWECGIYSIFKTLQTLTRLNCLRTSLFAVNYFCSYGSSTTWKYHIYLNKKTNNVCKWSVKIDAFNVIHVVIEPWKRTKVIGMPICTHLGDYRLTFFNLFQLSQATEYFIRKERYPTN